jgi:hypothetical protein
MFLRTFVMEGSDEDQRKLVAGVQQLTVQLEAGQSGHMKARARATPAMHRSPAPPRVGGNRSIQTTKELSDRLR